MNNVIVIGGGVNGITTALTLQLLGYETTCYAAKTVKNTVSSDPRFSSLYPAASVIPHSVNTDLLKLLFPASLSIFNYLYEAGPTIVKWSRHFEVAEFPRKPPAYINFMPNLAFIRPDDIRNGVPNRGDDSDLYGWFFDCYIAQWPHYMNQLYGWYRLAGGKIINRELKRNEIENLPTEMIINCSGLGTLDLFDDPAEPEIVRGHLVHIDNKEPIRDAEGRCCSYNYTPAPSIYSNTHGEACDVYCYPVAGKWVLGGSRQKGFPNTEGAWFGENLEDNITINDIEVPRPMMELNQQILKTTFGQVFNRDERMYAYTGYRFRRKAKNDIRLEKTERKNKAIIHNYGHGGAGVTLSWGCALYVSQMIRKKIASDGTNFDNLFLNNLQIQLREIYLNYYSF